MFKQRLWSVTFLSQCWGSFPRLEIDVLLPEWAHVKEMVQSSVSSAPVASVIATLLALLTRARPDVFVSSLPPILGAVGVNFNSFLAMLRAWRKVLIELAEAFFLVAKLFIFIAEASSRKAHRQFQALTGWSSLLPPKLNVNLHTNVSFLLPLCARFHLLENQMLRVIFDPWNHNS